VDKRNASGRIFRGTTTTAQSFDLYNEDGKFLHLIINVETAPASTITVTINGKARDKDGGGGNIYYQLLVSTALNAAGKTVMRIGPGLTAVGNLTINDVLPCEWNVSVVKGDASAWTYSLDYHILQ
jgi:hypothetical protein